MTKKRVETGGSLLEVLRQIAPESSSNRLRSWLQAGRVSVDGRRVDRANAQIEPGQEVEIGARVFFLRGGIRLIHQDEHLVVLEKPEGLLSVATDFESHMTVHSLLKRQLAHKKIFPVHRLDRETSGVMMFACSEAARDAMKTQFEQQQVDKTYLALVQGHFPERCGQWESYLEEDEHYYVHSTHNERRGKRAFTEYEVLRTSKGHSLLKLKPHTGRKNQLRVQCTEAGHPIIGDKKYGKPADLVGRLCLHAWRISFEHPVIKGKRMTFSSTVPLAFSQVIDCTDLIS